MTPADRLETLETEYLAARGARDRLDVARATGEADPEGALEPAARVASDAVHQRLSTFLPSDEHDLAADDLRAYRTIRSGIVAADEYVLPVAPSLQGGDCDDRAGWDAAFAGGAGALREHTEACFGVQGDGLPYGGRRLTRLQVLGRLAVEPDPDTRMALFLALQPLWRTMDGGSGGRSPYRTLVREDAEAWHAGASPIAVNAAALGVTPDDIETWALTALAAWRAAVVEPARARGEPATEPWDWWWKAGAARRILEPIPLESVVLVNRSWYASLGADPAALRVHMDLEQRSGRPIVPTAFTTFGERPARRPDGSWSPGRPTILMSLTDGGIHELEELVHETGHAVHLAGIRTRPAYADWPDSDAFIEAIAEIAALDILEPAWLRRWLPGLPEVPGGTAIRSRYAEVALDAAWALFEIRVHATPERDPNEIWAEITSTWLGIRAHPEMAWWAIRGQLIESPGYMANYAIAAVLATALRAAIRSEIGDWTEGNRDWYPWMRAHVYRFGLERPSRDVIHDLLGRSLNANALLGEIARAVR
ncbi:MAG: hypothetical protein WCK58_07295 [Chloroflexota bacterium]